MDSRKSLFIMDNRKPTFFEQSKNAFFNMRYKFISLFEEYDPKKIVSPGDIFCFLGKKFTADSHNVAEISEELERMFTSTAWVTYRSGFPELFKEEDRSTYISDTGWGCMIRVGQMAFAEIIKEHRRVPEDEMLEVVSLFNDCDETVPFSIMKISKQARRTFGIMPGSWYNPSQISYILAKLHRESLEKTDRLAFQIFNSGNLFYDEVFFKMINKSRAATERCECARKHKSSFCYECHKHINAVGIVCLARIGLECSEEKYLNVLSTIMEMKSFRGLIGGKPKKALYFLGRHNQDYIYLDPHYVQQASMKTESIKESYFCGSFRKCHQSQIDSSIGIIFYVRDFDQFELFMNQIDGIKSKNLQNFFLFVNEKTPMYAMRSESIEIKQSEDKDEYQRLG